jgi:outer membrane protein assembly factor BamD
MYQVGRCFFDQIYTIDRDQDNARKALAALNRFLERYPESEYADPARAHAKDCQRYIAANELLVAKYYFKNKNYKAAMNRFQGIIEDYPDIGIHHIALQYLAKCEDLVAAQDAARKKRTEGAE